jgi:hypothetical protein
MAGEGLVQVPMSTNVPGNDMYPVVTPPSVPPPQYLRPLRQPLYDTEIMPTTNTPAELAFFQRPQSQNTAYGSVNKSAAETNLTQAAQLPTPNQFSLFGFLIQLNAGVSLANFVQIYETCVFEFSFTGSRTYLQIPLAQIPQGLGPTGFSALYGQVSPTERTVITNGVPHVRNVYQFNLGKYALMIRSNETFGTKLRWPNGAPTIATSNVRIQSYLVGIYYQAI